MLKYDCLNSIKGMLSTQYLLIAPKKIVERKANLPPLKRGEILLKPKVCTICGSDLHYYLGRKDPKKLKERLPLALLHEGVCEIIKTKNKSKFKVGENVVVVPLNPCGKCYACKIGEFNLCYQAKFMASTSPGLARIPFAYDESLILPVPKNIPKEIAAMTEPFSIGLRAVKEAKINKQDKIIIIGDGPMAFFVALSCCAFLKIPQKNLFIVGMIEGKLNLMKKFAKTFNITQPQDGKILKNLENRFDVAFECVGGKTMTQTINQAIGFVKPKGRVVALGISDDFVSVKMIKLVNFGRQILGSSRSRKEDCKTALKLMKNKKIQKLLAKSLNPKKFYIKKAADLKTAFSWASDINQAGRTVVYFT